MMGISIPLGFDFTGAACFQMLLEEHALVRHVLVHDPQPLAVHRDDETRADLSQRLQVSDLFGARQARRRVRAWSGEIRGPISCRRNLRWSNARAKYNSGRERNPLLDWPHRRASQIESAIRTDAGAHADFFHRRNNGARHARFHWCGPHSA